MLNADNYTYLVVFLGELNGMPLKYLQGILWWSTGSDYMVLAGGPGSLLGSFLGSFNSLVGELKSHK